MSRNPHSPDSDKATPAYRRRLAPLPQSGIERLSAEARQSAPAAPPAPRPVARPAANAAESRRPAYLTRPGDKRDSAGQSEYLSDELRTRAAGRLLTRDWLMLCLCLGLLIFSALSRYHPKKFSLEFLTNPVTLWLLVFIILIGLLNYYIDNSAETHPDPMGAFEARALFNLVERGLLRQALEARDTHALLAPDNGSAWTRELVSSKRPLDNPDARIRFLIANYPYICRRRGYDWSVDSRRSGRYQWQTSSIIDRENRQNPYNRKLCSIIDELLRSGEY